MSGPVSRATAESSVDEVEFLARSDHRFTALEVVSEGPRTRDDLRGATGASSPTMGRIPSDFEGRRWIVGDARAY